MANKGNSGHIKRLNAPRYFAIHKKEHKYTIRPNPGRHSLDRSIALSLALGKLGLASKRSESTRIIKEGLVSVNCKKVLDPKYPIGLNDNISVGKENYSVGINERGQIVINRDESGDWQTFKIVGKYKYRGNKITVRLHDGSIIKDGTNDMKVNDSIYNPFERGDCPTQIRPTGDSPGRMVLKFGVGAKCKVISGVHVGKSGTIKEVNAGNMHKDESVIVEQDGGNKFETLVKNIIVVR